MKKLLTRFKNLPDRMSQSFKRFPLSLLYSILTVFVLIYITHSDTDNDLYSKIAMVLSLGIPLSLSIYIFFESKQNIKKSIRILLYILTPIILIGYYFLLLKDINFVSTTRYSAYIISLFIIFSFIPFIKRKENYELYVIRLFTRFIVTYIYSIVLYLGIAAILTTINLLFEVEISGEIFIDIALIIAGIFAPAFFLTDIPKENEKINIRSFPKVLKVLLEYIILPLISIYTVILYIYFIQIISTFDLPKNIIGNLVLWYALISTIVLFFIYPLRVKSKWVDIFIKVLPKAIIPLVGMMFWAIIIRINAYGITESRYFVTVAGIWVISSMIYYSFKRRIRNIWVTISLTAIIILSVTGPISSYSVSKWSQNNRFESLLKENDMLSDSLAIKPNENTEGEARKEISSIIRYFSNYHSIDDIKYLSDDFDTSDMKEVFGFDLELEYGYPSINEEYFSHFLSEEIILSIDDYDYFTEYNSYQPENEKEFSDDYFIRYSTNKDELTIKDKGEEIYSLNIDEAAKGIHKENTNKDMLNVETMTVVDENEAIKVKIVFKNFGGSSLNSSENINIEDVEFYVFINIK